MNRFLIVICTAVLLTACKYDNEESLYEANTCTTDEVTFSVHIAPIIQNSCATTDCHKAGGVAPGDFSSYEGLSASLNSGSFVNRVLVQKNMPPNGSLSDCEYDQIQAWVDAGSLNN